MSETQSPTVKPLFSVKDVMYIITIIGGLAVQYYSLKAEIHDAVMEQSFNKRELTQQITANTARLDHLDGKYFQLLTYALKPKEIKIESE